jgi:ubiquinone/menaquinone biosynthesis C-methylase UbiE
LATTITLTAELDASLDDFVQELTAALSRRGIAFDPDARAAEWSEADWGPDAKSELALRREGDRIVVELRGFGGSFWDDADLAGWFADAVAASFLEAASPAALGDWLTDRAARRPSGAAQREGYRDPSHHRPSFGAVLEALRLGPEDVLLEIGCGGGAFLEQALRSGCSAKAIDHSPELLRVARELNAAAVEEGRLELAQADAGELPFADGSCTCAAMMQVFFFLDAERVLAECRRVVRPGGMLAVFTVSEEAKGSPAAPEPMASRGRFYTDAQLAALARTAGFADAVVEHPDLERHAREAGLPEDLVELFAGANEMSQLLLAR